MKATKHGNRNLVGVIDEGCEIEGKIKFDGSLRLNGAFQGEVEGNGMLLVGSNGKAKASIRVDELVVEGKFEGNVTALTRVEIHKGGELHADISTNSLIIEEGGIFQGKSVMNVAETVDFKSNEEIRKVK